MSVLQIEGLSEQRQTQLFVPTGVFVALDRNCRPARSAKLCKGKDAETRAQIITYIVNGLNVAGIMDIPNM